MKRSLLFAAAFFCFVVGTKGLSFHLPCQSLGGIDKSKQKTLRSTLFSHRHSPSPSFLPPSASLSLLPRSSSSSSFSSSSSPPSRVYSRGLTRMGLTLTFGDDRVALVTGAGRGIGKAIALKLSAGGMKHVVCVSRSGCDDVVKLIKADGGSASSYVVDVANSADVAALCEKLLEEHQHIDVLVNNAGITKDNLFLRMTEKEWLDVIETNLNSVFYFTSSIIKRMLKRRYGRIINMTSVVGIGGNAGQCNYAASKAAVIGFTRSLGKEVAARNITVNAVAPGFIETQMVQAMTDKAKQYAVNQIPAGRMGQPEEVADTVAFLASEQAAYINGKVVPVDGAMLFGGN